MEFIDTHTHLFLSDFDSDRSKVIEQAFDAGVKSLLLPNIDSNSIAGMMQLCEQYPGRCFPMIGLHPTSVKSDYKEQIGIIKDHLKFQKFIAIGEVGIDLYWDKSFFTQQCDAFLTQMELAREYSLPVVIHSRDSFDEIIDILKKNRTSYSYKGVFHSFTGTLEQANEAISLGFRIGINGVVTFKNSSLGEVLKEVSLEHLLLETDSPYLTPAPHRGKRNESSYVVYVAKKIAEIKQLTIEEVALTTTNNAKTVFNLP
jgi:TatD DNase family protein